MRNIGFNIAGPPTADCRSLQFADGFLQSGNFNGPGSSAGYDADGWPRKVDGTAGAPKTILFSGANLPAGDFTLSGPGAGVVRVGTVGGTPFAGSDGQGRRTITLDGSGSPITLTRPSAGAVGVVEFEILSSSAGDPVRNLKFELPGHRGKMFNRAFLEQFRGMRCLRPLDWVNINNWTVEDWTDAQRLGAGFAMGMRGRVPEEAIKLFFIELRDYLGYPVHWHVQTPTLASTSGSGSWVQGLHDVIEGPSTFLGYSIPALPADVELYHEHGNELWNTGFNAQYYLDQRRTGPDAGRVAAWQAAHPGKFVGSLEYMALVKAEVCRKFKALFAGSSRVVHTTLMSFELIPSYGQVEADYHALTGLDGGPPTPVDVLGAAMYYYPADAQGNLLSNAALTAMADLYATNPQAAVDQFHQSLLNFQPVAASCMAQYKAKADAIGARFGIYEWGQHTSSFIQHELLALLTAGNNDPRAYGRTRALIDLMPADVELAHHYVDCAPDGDFFWGAWKYTGQPLAQAHVARAILDYMATDPPVTTPDRIPTRLPRGMRRLRIG